MGVKKVVMRQQMIEKTIQNFSYGYSSFSYHDFYCIFTLPNNSLESIDYEKTAQ